MPSSPDRGQIERSDLHMPSFEVCSPSGMTIPGMGLTLVALVYLAIPNLIFIFGWFRLPVALVLFAAMGVFMHGLFHLRPNELHRTHSIRFVMLIGATALAWAAFGGGSHFMYANHDWVIRDAVLGDLVRAEWPVTYKAPDGTVLTLRSAIGYFLPPALFAKAFGISHLGIAVYLWTAAGLLIFLLMLPLPQHGRWRLAMALVTVVFFSGMDFLGVVIATQSLPIFPLRLEWWGPLSYPSLTGQLLWAPNHCLPIWIGTLMILRHRSTRELVPISIALLPITLIWTPFAAVGLVPFAILGTWRVVLRAGWKDFPWRSAFAGSVFSTLVALFLLSDIGGIGFPSANTSTHAIQAASVAHLPVSKTSYSIFVSCEFLLLAIALAAHVREARDFFALSVLILLLLPALSLGPSNDLLLRLSSPPLVVLLVVCLQTLIGLDRKPYPATLWIAWGFLAIGSHTAFNELWRAATFQRWSANYGVSLAERQGGRPDAHYAGNMETSPAWKLLKVPAN